jgi:hypothetical protein
MSRLVLVAPLREGAREEVLRLIAAGPPFDLAGSDLSQHHVFVTDHEVVFVFEAAEARAAVERLAGDPAVWRAAGAWRACLAGRPRLAAEAFTWSKPGEG